MRGNKIVSIRVAPEVEEMLEARRIAGGHPTVSATLRALVADPGPRLFAMFEAGKTLVEIVIETGFSAEVVRAHYVSYRTGFDAPPAVPIPLAIEKQKTHRAALKLAATRESNELRERLRHEDHEARERRDRARADAQADRDNTACRLARLQVWNRPRAPIK